MYFNRLRSKRQQILTFLSLRLQSESLQTETGWLFFFQQTTQTQKHKLGAGQNLRKALEFVRALLLEVGSYGSVLEVTGVKQLGAPQAKLLAAPQED